MVLVTIFPILVIISYIRCDSIPNTDLISLFSPKEFIRSKLTTKLPSFKFLNLQKINSENEVRTNVTSSKTTISQITNDMKPLRVWLPITKKIPGKPHIVENEKLNDISKIVEVTPEELYPRGKKNDFLEKVRSKNSRKISPPVDAPEQVIHENRTYGFVWYPSSMNTHLKTYFRKEKEQQKFINNQIIKKTDLDFHPHCQRHCKEKNSTTDNGTEVSDIFEYKARQKRNQPIIALADENDRDHEDQAWEDSAGRSARTGGGVFLPEMLPKGLQTLSVLTNSNDIKPNTLIETVRLVSTNDSSTESNLTSEDNNPIYNYDLKFYVYEIHKRLISNFSNVQKASIQTEQELAGIIRRSSKADNQIVELLHSIKEDFIRVAFKSVHQACGMMLTSLESALNKVVSTITYTDNMITGFLKNLETCLKSNKVAQMPLHLNDQLIKCSQGKLEYISVQIDQAIKYLDSPRLFFAGVPKRIMACMNHIVRQDGLYEIQLAKNYETFVKYTGSSAANQYMEPNETALCLAQVLEYISQKSIELSADLIGIGTKTSDIIWNLNSNWVKCVKDKIKVAEANFDKILKSCSKTENSKVIRNKN